MATTTTVRTYEYDAAGRCVKETTVVETVGPYASGGVVTTTIGGGAMDGAAILAALKRLKDQRVGEGLGLG